MTHVIPYLNFNGSCKEAMTFYQQCLGGSLSLMTIGETPMAEQMPHMKDAIMHSTLLREGVVLLMASDGMGSQLQNGNTVTLMIDCASESEIRALFPKLSEGGNVTHPLQDEFWGAIFGHFTDKFGTNWMLNYQKQ